MSQILAYNGAPERGKYLRQLESHYISKEAHHIWYKIPPAQLNNQQDKVETSRRAETVCWEYPEFIKQVTDLLYLILLLLLFVAVLQKAEKQR